VRTRDTILRKAVGIASVGGLEGLTIGKLSTALRISKSGLFAHFGSKEELQIAVIETARDIFIDEVIRPTVGLHGRKRLEGLCRHWLSYAERGVFPGGCFFSAASMEFDDRPGKVRDFLVALMNRWLSGLEEAVREAQESGEIDRSVDAHQIAFEIHSLEMGANWSSRLLHDKGAFDTGWHAIRERLDRIATERSRK
jgi:AcrR family transcriptional regulator